MFIKSMIPALFLFVMLSPAFASDEDSVRETMLAHMKAQSQGEFQKSYDLQDTNSQEYIVSLLDKVLHSDKQTLEAMPLLDKVMVLQIRSQVEAEDIKKFTAIDLYRVMSNNNQKNPDKIDDIKIGEVEVSGNTATAEANVPGTSHAFPLYLTKENETWKMDMLSFQKHMNEVVEDVFAKMDPKMANQLIPGIIESQTDKPFDEAVWNPIVAK